MVDLAVDWLGWAETTVDTVVALFLVSFVVMFLF
jgi:hypothetical protein